MEKREYMFIFIIGIIAFSIYFIVAQQVGVNIGHFYINFISPLNSTYSFYVNEPYRLVLNVTSNRNVTLWNFTHIWNNTILNNSENFNPPIQFLGRRGANKIIVSAKDNYNNTYNSSISFTLNIINRAPIISGLNNNIYVCENKWLSEWAIPNSIFQITEPDLDIISYYLVPSDPFYIGFLGEINETTGSYEIFSGILNKSDAGGVNSGGKNYTEIVFVSDGENVESKEINITVIEVNNPPLISNIGAKTVWTRGANSSFNYIVRATDVENGDENSGNLFFNVSFIGQNLFTIDSSNGVINFTANESYKGVHNITVCVRDLGILYPHPNITLCGQDGSSIVSCINFSLTVTDENRRPEFLFWNPENFSITNYSDSDFIFNISVYDADGTIPDVYWYVDDEFKYFDLGIETGLNHSFFYNFGCGIGGRHNVTAVITDGELNNSLTWNVTLIFVDCPSYPSGGGGGFSTKVSCVEKWGCKEWSDCKNLKKALDSNDNIFGLFLKIKERCNLFNWNEDNCGYQTRTCKDVNKCGTNFSRPGFVRECFYSVNPTCFDGIKNCHNGSCEILTDCGGPCKPCPTCSDKIRNQGEMGVDCGGPCSPCLEKESAKERFNYIKIALPSFFILIVLLMIIIFILVSEYFKKKRRLVEINKPKKRF
ncbi:MAG: hypothetical protein QXW97_01755 [Candidatus Pacearchaeota archaeon]